MVPCFQGFGIAGLDLLGHRDALEQLVASELFVGGGAAVEVVVPAVVEQAIEDDSHEAVIVDDDPFVPASKGGKFVSQEVEVTVAELVLVLVSDLVGGVRFGWHGGGSESILVGLR